MQPIRLIFRHVLTFSLFISCSPVKVSFKRPVDSSSKAINFQNKTTYSFKDQNLTFSNEFDGARLNGVKQVNDSIFQI